MMGRETDDYRMMPIPVPPFRDNEDRDAALGAALVHVTKAVTGHWPMPDAIRVAVERLTERP